MIEAAGVAMSMTITNVTSDRNEPNQEVFPVVMGAILGYVASYAC